MKKLPNLLTRTITTVILLSLVILVYWCNILIFKFFAVIAGFGMLYEWQNIISNKYKLKSPDGLRWIIFAIFYSFIPVFCVLYLINHNAFIYLVAIVISTDIGGYIFGSLIGGYKLAPAISPKKTWSGFFGGILCAIIMSSLVNVHISILLALGLSVIAQLGDLLESSVKRHFKVKDSGKILPGHGGILDRLDSMVTSSIMLTIIIMLSPRIFS